MSFLNKKSKEKTKIPLIQANRIYQNRFQNKLPGIFYKKNLCCNRDIPRFLAFVEQKNSFQKSEAQIVFGLQKFEKKLKSIKM